MRVEATVGVNVEGGVFVGVRVFVEVAVLVMVGSREKGDHLNPNQSSAPIAPQMNMVPSTKMDVFDFSKCRSSDALGVSFIVSSFSGNHWIVSFITSIAHLGGISSNKSNLPHEYD